MRMGTAVAAFAGLFLLNAGLTMHNLWPTLWVGWTGEASVELAVVVVVLAGLAFRRSGVSPWARRGLSVLLTLWIVFRFLDITAPAMFGRRIDLYWDLPHVPNLIGMLVQVAPPWQVAAIGVGVPAVLALLALLVSWSVGAMARACERPRVRRGAIVGGLIAIGLYGAGMGNDRIGVELHFAIPVATVVAQQAAHLAAAADPDATDATDSATVLPPADLGRLRGGDVYLIYLQSYGAVVYDRGDADGPLAPLLDDLEAAAGETGRHVASAFMGSPTFAGASWLAHLTGLSGAWVPGNGAYHRLLKSGRHTLVDRFRDGGYRTVALVPGIRKAWPEGAALRFDRIYDAPSLAYGGPRYGWWQIPDQYSLEWLARREIAPRDRAPLFLFFPTITSHAPFTPVAPIAEDWSRAVPAPAGADVAPAEGWAALSPVRMAEFYRRTMAYDLALLAGFLRQRAPPDAVVIALGDHQPPAAISGPDARHDVPVHVFAPRADLLAPLFEAGFRPTVRPEAAVGPMDRLPFLLLEAFSAATQPGT